MNKPDSFTTEARRTRRGAELNFLRTLRASVVNDCFVTELRVADSVQLAANGILASEKVIAEDPELVRGFVEAFVKGLKFTIENPDEAYALSATYIPNFADLDEKVQKEILNTSIQMWSADRLGYSDPQAWENMQNILLEMGLITDNLDLGKSFTNEFVP